MKILVGLKGPGLSELRHSGVKIESLAGSLELSSKSTNATYPGAIINVRPQGDEIIVESPGTPGEHRVYKDELKVETRSGNIKLLLYSGNRQVHSGQYSGRLLLKVDGGKLLVLLESDLEVYVRGVLRSEVPASYHIEAMKAQAVLARTYALRPRIDHSVDGFNVCDSFTCCQAFNGVDPALTAGQKAVIEETKGKVLTYDGKPALALFSANAGGHTEDYSNCFSNLKTNKFPDDPLPYLKGIPEGKLPHGFPSEAALRQLWALPKPETVDAWSATFRWQAHFTADTLEGHMHHVIETLRKEAQFAPFIVAPESQKFGHIQGFEVTRRGVSGVAMELAIRTSTGTWTIAKELTIRSVFGNPDMKLKRLRSGRIFFDQQKDKLGMLSAVTVFGLGFGHGVGLQQNGAQGLALQGMPFDKILSRYYPGTVLSTVH